MFFTKDPKLSSNPFLNYVTDNHTNPFHESFSNPFLSNNPFRNEEERKAEEQTMVDGTSTIKQVCALAMSFYYHLGVLLIVKYGRNKLKIAWEKRCLKL